MLFRSMNQTGLDDVSMTCPCTMATCGAGLRRFGPGGRSHAPSRALYVEREPRMTRTMRLPAPVPVTPRAACGAGSEGSSSAMQDKSDYLALEASMTAIAQPRHGACMVESQDWD